MNVPGMPWHSHRARSGRHDKRPGQASEEQAAPVTPLTGKETRNLMLQAVFTALVIGLVFLSVIFLFILFSLKVWLK